MGRVIKSGRLRSYAACLRVAKSPRLLALMGRVARRRAPLLHDAISIKCGAFSKDARAARRYRIRWRPVGLGQEVALIFARFVTRRRNGLRAPELLPVRLLAQPSVEATSPIAGRRT